MKWGRDFTPFFFIQNNSTAPAPILSAGILLYHDPTTFVKRKFEQILRNILSRNCVFCTDSKLHKSWLSRGCGCAFYTKHLLIFCATFSAISLAFTLVLWYNNIRLRDTGQQAKEKNFKKFKKKC